MNDLVDFQTHRIQVLEKKVTEYEVLLLELTDKDCPEEYKRVIRRQILNG